MYALRCTEHAILFTVYSTIVPCVLYLCYMTIVVAELVHLDVELQDMGWNPCDVSECGDVSFFD